MTDVQQVKKKLFEDFEKFNSFFADKVQLSSESFREILALNKSMFQKLREVLDRGTQADRKEAMELFQRVMNTFGVLSKQIVASSGISPEIMKEITSPLSAGNRILDPEHLKMVSKLGEDLENMVKKIL